MFAPLSFYHRVIFTTILVTSNIVVHGFSESSCPENATVDLTGDTSEGFTKNLTWFKDNRSFGCSCNVKTCVSFCCAPGMAQIDGWQCVVDNDTSVTFPMFENLEYKETYPIVDDPCRFNWMASSVLTEFKVFPNGSLQAPDYDGESHSDLEHYCMFRKPDSDKFFAKVCRPWVRKNFWDMLGWVIAALVMLIILVGSTTIPEMRNLHGATFRCYVAAYMATYICALASELSSLRRTLPDFFTPFETMARYCGGCCLFWLNAMSFNIWRSFRWLRPVDYNANRFECRLFVWYAIYACVGPALCGIFLRVIIHTIPRFNDDILRLTFRNWACAAVTLTILVCNCLFYILTTLDIKHHHKTTTRMVDAGLNKNHEVDLQWFRLYLKLFVIMGGHLTMWPIFFIWPAPEVTHVFAALEVLQSILIFYIFLWKTEFKVSVNSAMDRIVRFFRKGLTPEAARC